jgi:hypothetical protein
LYRDHDKALAHRDGKNCAILACHRDSFPARTTDIVQSGGLAHNRDNQPDGCPPERAVLYGRAPVTFTIATAVPLAFSIRAAALRRLYLQIIQNWLLNSYISVSADRKITYPIQMTCKCRVKYYQKILCISFSVVILTKL